MNEDTIFIKKVEQIILNNLDNSTLNGVFIAKELGLSRMQLYRKLKQITNQSSQEYINHIRIAYAKKQLQTSSKFIYQIAKECGFRHYTYFSKRFKKNTGYTPVQYRQKYLE